jgi:preprotein translocase subunit SecE
MTNHQVEPVNQSNDKILPILSALVLLGGIVAFYLLANQSIWLRWLVMVAAASVAAIVFARSSLGEQLHHFGLASSAELRKMVWPSRKETAQATGVVFAFMAVMALFLWFVDSSVEWLVFAKILNWK